MKDHLLRRRKAPPRTRLRLPMVPISLGLTLLACVAIVAFSIVPSARTWADLSTKLDTTRRALARSEKARADSPEAWQRKIAAAEASLGEATGLFVSEAQAADMLTRLNEHATRSGVAILSLQSKPGQRTGGKVPFEIRALDLQATGALPRLFVFLSRIQEVSLKGLAVTNVSITEAGPQHRLSASITLYTSPLAGERPLPPTGNASPAAQAMVRALEEALHLAWATRQWKQVQALVEQAVAIDPTRRDMLDKLYAAHVNQGYELYTEGDVDGAVAAFQAALQVKPHGPEALSGLRRTTPTPEPTATPVETPAPAPTPTPEPLVYTVRAGDTLYSIARRHATTVEAIMAANRLDSPTVRAGQQLLIPTP